MVDLSSRKRSNSFGDFNNFHVLYLRNVSSPVGGEELGGDAIARVDDGSL